MPIEAPFVTMDELLDVVDAIDYGGLDLDHRPHLAIARADRRQVRFSWTDRHHVVFDSRKDPGWGREYPELVLRYRLPTQENVREGSWWPSRTGWALVPMVPPSARPQKGQLRDYFILWEVEGGWSESRLDARTELDPLLLKPVSGSLFAVVAEWELTELQRMVMAGRARGDAAG